MQLNEKLRFMRHLKKWSQEEVAHRLNLSASAYGSMECGETKLSFPRLEEIAKVFEIELAELIDFNEKNVFAIIVKIGITILHLNNSLNYNTNSKKLACYCKNVRKKLAI